MIYWIGILLEYLTGLGLCDRWINSTMQCITTTSSKITVNGRLETPFNQNEILGKLIQYHYTYLFSAEYLGATFILCILRQDL